MVRRRFMFNTCRWLWRKITEKVLLKCSLDQAPTKSIEIEDSVENPKNSGTIVSKDVTDLNMNRGIITQKLINLQARLRADPVFIKNIVFIRSSKIISIPVKLFRIVKDHAVERVSDLMRCLVYLTSYIVDITVIRTVKGVKADAIPISSEKREGKTVDNVGVDYVDTLEYVSIDSTIPKDTHYASIVCWIHSILENGELTISQVCSATQIGDILEIDIMDDWIDNILEDGILTITQVYGITQNGDNLEVI